MLAFNSWFAALGLRFGSLLGDLVNVLITSSNPKKPRKQPFPH